MSRDKPIFGEEAVRRVAYGALAHAAVVSLLFLTTAFLNSALRRGVSATSERLTISSAVVMARLGPTFDRLERLIDQPEDFGFKLYQLNELFDPRWPGLLAARIPTTGPGPDDPDGPGPRPTPGPAATPTPATGVDPGPGHADFEENARHQELLRWLGGLRTFDAAARKELLDRTRALAFNEGRARLLLVSLADVPGPGVPAEDLDREKLQFFREFLGMPPRGMVMLFTAAQLELLAKNHTFDSLVRRLEDKLGFGALRALLATNVAAATPTPTAGHRLPDVAEIPTGARDFTVEEYRQIEQNELLWRACQSKQAELLKAFERYKRASATPVTKLDLAVLRQMGFLASPPTCPTNGEFSLDRDGKIQCSQHGGEAQPSVEHQRYEALFKRFTIARNLYLGNRYGEALFHLEKIVQEHPNHVQAQEHLALCKKELKRWGEAAQALHQVCNLVADDARLYYDAATCFYAADNRTMAGEYLTKCLAASWDGSQRSITRPKDFYLLRDRAAFMAQSVAGKRYLDFKLVKEPVFPTEQCEERLGALRATLKKLVDDYYQQPLVKPIIDEVAALEARLAGLREFEVDERQKVSDQLTAARRRLDNRIRGKQDDKGWPGAGTLPRFLADRLGSADVPIEFCPAGERYFVDPYFNLECATHRGLLVDATLDERVRLADRTRRVLNEALVKRFASEPPERRECFARQARLLDLAQAEGVALGPPLLDALAAKKVLQPGEDACPSTRARYEIKAVPGRANHLSCSSHGSFGLLMELPEEGGRGRP